MLPAHLCPTCRARGWRGPCRLPAMAEPARRRREKLVDRLLSMSLAALAPRHEGYYGQLIPSGDDLAEMGELQDVRRAARKAGRRLGRKTATRPTGGRLFVLDERDVPEENERRAADATAVANAPKPLRREPGHRCRCLWPMEHWREREGSCRFRSVSKA